MFNPEYVKSFFAFALFVLVSGATSAQDIPINLEDDGRSVDYYHRAGSINQFYNSNLIDQISVERMLEFGIDPTQSLNISYSRLSSVLTQQIIDGVVSFDPNFPEEGDKRTSTGDRREGNLVYTHTFTEVYIVGVSGGSWVVFERSKVLKEVIPEQEEEMGDDGEN